MTLKPDKFGAAIFFTKPVKHALFVLGNTDAEVIRVARIEGSVTFIRHDICKEHNMNIQGDMLVVKMTGSPLLILRSRLRRLEGRG